METINVKMPDGRIIRNVPKGTTKAQLLEKLSRYDEKSKLAETTAETSLPERKPEIGEQMLEGLGIRENADELGRQALRLGKDAATGLVAGAEVFSRPLGVVLEKITGQKGLADSPSQFVSSNIDKLTGGLTAPRNGLEEFTSGAAQALASGGTLAGAGALAKGLNPIAAKIAQNITPKSAKELSSYVGAYAGGEAGEAIGDTPGRIVGTLAGGLIPSAFGGSKTGLMDDIDSIDAKRGAVDVVRDKFGAAKKQVDDLFEIARETGKPVLIAKQAIINPMAKNIAGRLDEKGIFLDVKGMELPNRYLENLGDLATKNKLSLNQLEQWRRNVTRQANSSTDANVKLAFQEIRGAYDDVIKSVAKESILRGDKKAVDLWRTAIAKRSEMGNFFQKDKLSGRSAVFEDIIKNESLTNEKIARAITLGNVDAGNVAKNLLRAAGNNSDIVRDNLRKGLVFDVLERGVSDGKLLKVAPVQNGLRQLISNRNATLRDALFDEKDIAAIRKLANALDGGVPDRAILRPIEQIVRLPVVSAGGQVVEAGIRGMRRIRNERQVEELLTEIYNVSGKELKGKSVFYGGLIPTLDIKEE